MAEKNQNQNDETNNATRMRVALCCEYDGSNFLGFQRQPEGRSVQRELELALSQIYKRPMTIFGCSRTDAGVHARAHVSHTNVPFWISEEKIPPALNALLPMDLVVNQAAYAKDFHARFDAKGKSYVYRIWHQPIRPALMRHQMTHLPGKLDLVRMKEAAQYLIGEHNFAAFSAEADSKVLTLRQIDRITIEKDEALVKIEVTGRSFLQHMVRILVGTLVYVGQGKIEPRAIPDIIASKDRRQCGKTMPAKGLTLEKVHYDPDPFSH